MPGSGKASEISDSRHEIAEIARDGGSISRKGNQKLKPVTGEKVSALLACFMLVLTAQAGAYSPVFSTYLGGSSVDQLRDIATDRSGYIYITGGTESADFPTTSGAYDTTHNGWYDVFVVKLTPDGDVVWSTFVGGSNYDRAYAIEVDTQGYVYVAGRAGPGFPTTPGAFQTQYLGHDNGIYGQQNAFAFKMNPDGGALVWSSYFGVTTLIRDFDIDENGDLYVTSGYWPGMSPDSLPQNWVANAYQKSPIGGRDGVVAKIRTDGTQVEWATYLGGSGDEGIEASIRVDSAHSVYVLQFTMSVDAPRTPDAYDTTHNGNWDYYLARLTPDGSGLVFGTYLGGSQNEFISTHNLGLNRSGDPYVLSSTGSSDYPTTPGAYQETYAGGTSEIAVSRFSTDGTHLVASTFVGGSLNENAEGITVDTSGQVYFSGDCWSTDFPVTPDAYQLTHAGGQDGFILGLSPDLSQLVYSTYLGGSDDDGSRAFTLDQEGSIFFAGWTRSVDFPLFNPYQDSLLGDWDLALAKFAPPIGRQEEKNECRPSFGLLSGVPSRNLSIYYTLVFPGFVELELYDLAGRVVGGERAWKDAGSHDVSFEIADLASGIYFLRIEAPGVSATAKAVLIR